MDHRRFILANTRVVAPPLVPELKLHLADEATALWEQTEAALGTQGLPPPYWAFAWAGGQALARHLLDHPERVAGHRVLDFAAGSGVVAIAALKAGAAQVVANEIDAFALAAIALNSDLNGVAPAISAADLIGRLDLGVDVVLAGDVCYERPMAERVTAWLAALAGAGTVVLIGDPGRSYLPQARLTRLASYAVPVSRALEDAEVKQTGIWRFGA